MPSGGEAGGERGPTLKEHAKSGSNPNPQMSAVELGRVGVGRRLGGRLAVSVAGSQPPGPSGDAPGRGDDELSLHFVDLTYDTYTLCFCGQFLILLKP